MRFIFETLFFCLTERTKSTDERIILMAQELNELLSIDDISSLIRMSKAAIYTEISVGSQNIPPSILVGRRRRWRKSDYITWEQSL